MAPLYRAMALLASDATCSGSQPDNLDREIIEEWKWMGSPKGKVKLTFSRAIDFFEGDKINERALKNLVRAAVEYNQIKLKKRKAGPRAKVPKSKK